MAATGRSDCRFAHNLMETIMQTLPELHEACTSLIAYSQRTALTAAISATLVPSPPPASLAAARRWCASLSLAAAVVALGAGQASANPVDSKNGWNPLPANVNPTGYEFDFQGDVRYLIPTQLTTDKGVNPFYAQSLYNGASYNSISVNYDSGANLTRVLLSGDALPNPVPPDWPGGHHVWNGVDSYHTGLDEVFPGEGDLPPVVSQHWISPEGNFEMPALEVEWKAARHLKKRKLPLDYAVIYVEAADGAGGTWTQTPYEGTDGAPARPVQFMITNNTDAPISIAVIGYILNVPGPVVPAACEQPCAGDVAILDSLQDTDYPTPDEPGSKFVLVKGPGGPLQPGQSFVFNAR
jgi:hypothetical protein